MIDEAGSVRGGEELDAAKVHAFLRGVEPGLANAAAVPEIRQFSGGASNLTYLVRYPERDFILRRPPFGHKAKSAHDMKRESSIMAALRPAYEYVPRVIAYSDDLTIMGSEFYVMERLPGIILRKDFPKGLKLTAKETRTLCTEVLDRLIELHKVDLKAAGLTQLGKGEGYVQRQISGWSERYRNARTPDAKSFEDVMAWLDAKKPQKEVAICLIHNDFRFDNVVLDEEDPLTIIGVLDWEMATIGDPLMDLGNTLAYWVEPGDDPMLQAMRRQPTHMPGMLTRKEVVEYYAERTGFRVDHFDFYEVYGLFRLAVILQQIYYRFHHGQSTNPAFAMFGALTNHLESVCLKRIATSKL